MKLRASQTMDPAQERDDRLQDLMNLHFDPELGSPYWLRRRDKLDWDPRDRIRTLKDLWLLGPTPLEDLRAFPLVDFIPQAFHSCLDRFVTGETAGTGGTPCRTAYRDDEFQEAFIDPFLLVAAATEWPNGEPWLWLGPSGPHIIGKVVRELARQTGCLDPFSVDFDPRWAKRLPEGGFARRRYLDHLLEQACALLAREPVHVLFSTPPVLSALAERLSDCQREAIHGVHYGGMSLSAAAVNGFRAAFPNAVHLAGYGNTLFGVLMEMADGPRQALDYFPLDERLAFHVVALPDRGSLDSEWPPRECSPGQTGRVLFHRLDESCLLVGVVERDEAERIVLSDAARKLGGVTDGLRNPRPALSLQPQLRQGIY